MSLAGWTRRCATTEWWKVFVATELTRGIKRICRPEDGAHSLNAQEEHQTTECRSRRIPVLCLLGSAEAERGG